MKELRLEFRKSGFEHELVKREGDVAMYRKSRGEYEGYEVVEVRRQKAATYGPVEIEAGERYPSDREWGRYGWTYRDKEDAERKFLELVRERSVLK